MKCPHCTTSVHGSWSDNHVSYPNVGSIWHVQIMKCPECSKEILRLGVGRIKNNAYVIEDFRQIHPVGSNRGPVPADVPSDIAADYTEAALVLSLSPKASAALSRRCLQSVLRD